MKGVLTFVSIMIFSIMSANAQNYNEYLSVAWKHLTERNFEKAQKAYEVWCDMTGLTNTEFENKIKEEKEKSMWKNNCFFFDLSDNEVLVVQKITLNQSPVSHYDALRFAENSRLGGFSDWRLPEDTELRIILSNLSRAELPYNTYWTLSDKTDNSVKNVTYSFSIYMNRSGERFLLVVRNRLERLSNVKEYSILKFGDFTVLDIPKGPFYKYNDSNSPVKHNYFIVRKMLRENIVD